MSISNAIQVPDLNGRLTFFSLFLVPIPYSFRTRSLCETHQHRLILALPLSTYLSKAALLMIFINVSSPVFANRKYGTEGVLQSRTSIRRYPAPGRIRSGTLVSTMDFLEPEEEGCQMVRGIGQGKSVPFKKTRSELISPASISAALTLAMRALAAVSLSFSAEYELFKAISLGDVS